MHKTVPTFMSQDTSPFVPPPPEDDMLIGAIVHYGGPTVPAKYLRADGSAVSRATYAALFAAYGTTWGAGDGVTTFNLPDLRGRTLIGAGNGAGLTPRVLAATGGEETHTLLAGEQPVHTHGVTDPGHSHTVPFPWLTGSSGAGNIGLQGANATDGPVILDADGNTTGVTVNNSAGGDPHANMQPWAAAFPLVYAGV